MMQGVRFICSKGEAEGRDARRRERDLAERYAFGRSGGFGTDIIGSRS